jgi:ABC-type Fe3+-hydroxamate transport system substrate-binding protein
MINSQDQLGREIVLPDFPRRIISLVPSITELIWDLGLQDELIGITKFCIHPDEMFQKKTRIGGTKNINISLIQNLKPDLIIGNKEENTKDDIDELIKIFPVWMSDVNTIDDAIAMIKEIGRITNKTVEANKIIKGIKLPLKNISESKNVIYLIWHEPCYAVGGLTFINDMLLNTGFNNCIKEYRYPEITGEMIRDINPDFLFLSSEPFPFQKSHIEYYKNFIPEEKIKLVDGEMFSWYGSRMTKAFEYFKKLQIELNHRR